MVLIVNCCKLELCHVCMQKHVILSVTCFHGDLRSSSDGKWPLAASDCTVTAALLMDFLHVPVKKLGFISMGGIHYCLLNSFRYACDSDIHTGGFRPSLMMMWLPALWFRSHPKEELTYLYLEQ